MIKGWISLRVEDPEHVGERYQKLGFDVVGRRTEVGSVAVGRKDEGRAIVLLPGPRIKHPERLQLHFAVPDVDDEYVCLQQQGNRFSEPPKDALAVAPRIHVGSRGPYG